MIPASVRYARASSVEHALELLEEPDSRAIAGGQSLVPLINADGTSMVRPWNGDISPWLRSMLRYQLSGPVKACAPCLS